VEELFEEQDGPVDGDVEGAGLGGDVGGVDTELEHLLLRVELLFVRLPVDQQLAIASLVNCLLLNVSFHVGEVARVTSHVSRQNDSDKALTEGLEVVAGEVFEEVVFHFVEDREGLGGVEVLLH